MNGELLDKAGCLMTACPLLGSRPSAGSGLSLDCYPHLRLAACPPGTDSITGPGSLCASSKPAACCFARDVNLGLCLGS